MKIAKMPGAGDLPTGRQGSRGKVPKLRQPALQVRPDQLSRLSFGIPPPACIRPTPPATWHDRMDRTQASWTKRSLTIDQKYQYSFFITDYVAVDRIIDHLRLMFVAKKPSPPRIAYQELLMTAETSAEYFS